VKPLAVALVLLCSGLAQALPDGGVADAPLAAAGVEQVDGGWFLTNERFAIVGQHLAQPCPATEPPVAQSAVAPFLYGVATGAVVVAVAVLAAVAYGVTR